MSKNSAWHIVASQQIIAMSFKNGKLLYLRSYENSIINMTILSSFFTLEYAGFWVSLHPLFPLHLHSNCFLPSSSDLLKAFIMFYFCLNPSFTDFLFIWTKILSVTFKDSWRMQIPGGVLSMLLWARDPLLSHMLFYSRLCDFIL